MTEYQHHWSRFLWMFSPFPWLWRRADGRRYHQPLKEFDRQQADCPALASEIKPGTFAILQQICNFTGWKLTWQLVFRASIQFFVLDAASQTQHITNYLVKVSFILIVQSSLLVLGYFNLFRQNGSQHLWKCSWKGMTELSVSPWTTGSRQVLTSASWISPIGQPN